MITGKLTTSAAFLALMVGLGGTAWAQSPTTDQTAPAAQADQALPEALAQLNLTDLEIKTKRGGIREVEGRTAEGVEIEAKIAPSGEVIKLEADDGVLPQPLINAYVPQAARDHEFTSLFAEINEIKRRPDSLEIKGNQNGGKDIEARFDAEGKLIGAEVDDGALPDTIVQALLPQTVRDSETIGQFAQIEEIAQVRGVWLVKGEDADGKEMGAAFDQEGRLVRFGREGEHRGGPDGMHHGHGPKDGPHGMGHKDRHGDGHRFEGRRGEHGERGARGDRRGAEQSAPSFDPVAVNKTLSDAGYTGFGFMRQQGPDTVLEAVNPQGESVLLQLNDKGEVVRESAR